MDGMELPKCGPGRAMIAMNASQGAVSPDTAISIGMRVNCVLFRERPGCFCWSPQALSHYNRGDKDKPHHAFGVNPTRQA